MSKCYFECAVRYGKGTDNLTIKRVTGSYIVEADFGNEASFRTIKR